MPRRHRTLAGCAIIAAALVPASASAFPSGTLGPNACHIGFPDIEAKDICFFPSQVLTAERRMPVTPIHPGQIVWRLTGLRLRHVMLRVAGRPFDIEYLNGRMPLAGTPYQVPSLSGARPKYVLIDENTDLANRLLPRPVAQGGYWVYGRNLACRHIALFVTTNLTSTIAVAVADRLQGVARCDT